MDAKVWTLIAVLVIFAATIVCWIVQAEIDKIERQRRMAHHELKTHPEHFDAVWRGVKRFEMRWNDRGFELGDHLKLMEYRHEDDIYTGREIYAHVTHVLDSQAFSAVPNGWVILSIYVDDKWTTNSHRPV